MSDKSHVIMERHQCLACGVEYETGVILLDKRLRKVFERYTTTGNGLCPEHTKEGFITLIAATRLGSGPTVKAGDDVRRTGEIAMLRREIWCRVFDTEIPPQGVAFVDPGVIDRLKAIPVEGDEDE
jgi:hypothetical protein